MTTLDRRYKNGGKRSNAGRKSLGVTRKVSITLPEDLWREVELIAADPKYKSVSAVFRALTEHALR